MIASTSFREFSSRTARAMSDAALSLERAPVRSIRSPLNCGASALEVCLERRRRSGEVTTPMQRGKIGSGRLRSTREQTVGGQSLLELLERELKGAGPNRLHVIDDELILAACVVNRKPAARDDVQPVFRNKANHSILHPEAGATQRGGFVLEREIPVSDVWRRKFDISPSTYTSMNSRSTSVLSRAVSSDTDTARRCLRELFEKTQLRHGIPERPEGEIIPLRHPASRARLKLFPIKRLEAEDGPVNVEGGHYPFSAVSLFHEARALDGLFDIDFVVEYPFVVEEALCLMAICAPTRRIDFDFGISALRS